MSQTSESGAPPRVFLVIAAVLVTALAVTVAVLGLLFSPTGGNSDGPAAPGPLPLVSIPAPRADTPECAKLVRAAPSELESAGELLQRRRLAEPAPPSTLAWGTENSIVLRCGLDRPPELTRTSSLRVINGVQWLEVPGENSATWYVVDRAVYMALTVPADAGTGPLQQVSDTVARTLPSMPPRFG